MPLLSSLHMAPLPVPLPSSEGDGWTGLVRNPHVTALSSSHGALGDGWARHVTRSESGPSGGSDVPPTVTTPHDEESDSRAGAPRAPARYAPSLTSFLHSLR